MYFDKRSSLILYLHRPVFNSLPNDKILDQSKLKTFVDNWINFNKNFKYYLERIETLRDEEKMLVTSIFSFSTLFSKALFPKVVQSWDFNVNR